jgi:hypothetical protein
MAITPSIIYEGSYGFEIVFNINKPIAAESTYKLFILGPSSDTRTEYIFNPSTDYQDISAGILVYTAQQNDFPVKGNYKLQLAELQTTPQNMQLFSNIVFVPVHDSIPVT